MTNLNNSQSNYSMTVEDCQKEHWQSLKGIVTYGDHYEISTLGRLRNSDTQKVLSTTLTKAGYPSIKLYLDGEYIRYDVHRLVGIAFIPRILGKDTINHKNGIKTDNRIENLEWLTQKENVQHAVDTGLRKLKLSKTDVDHILFLYQPRSKEYGLRALALQFGVSKETIRTVVNGNYQAVA